MLTAPCSLPGSQGQEQEGGHIPNGSEGRAHSGAEEADWGPRVDSLRGCLKRDAAVRVTATSLPWVPPLACPPSLSPKKAAEKPRTRAARAPAHARSSVPASSAGEPTRRRASAVSHLAEGRGQVPCRRHTQTPDLPPTACCETRAAPPPSGPRLTVGGERMIYDLSALSKLCGLFDLN